MDLKNFIKVYDDVLDENLCRNIIYNFDKDSNKVLMDDPAIKFAALNMTDLAENANDHEWGIMQNQIVTALKACGQQYIIDVDCEKYMPQKNGLEQIKVVKYSANDGKFDEHIDVGDYPSARRFLTYFCYLNDVEDGGETYFKYCDYAVKAKRGRIVMFPPTWQYPHAGITPKSDDKYILTTYLHYQ
jgi:prolyl 4-hydroxylase